MDAFFETQTSAQGVGTKWSFSEFTVAKPSLQRPFLMWFVSPTANQDILNQNWKMCFELWAKHYFQWTQKSVRLNCYDSFKCRLQVFRCQLSNSCHCLVYILLEDLNQISRTEKCHFAFTAFYIFHEQRFHSFTSRFVKSIVVAWWCFLWFISICKYMYKLTKKDILYIMWISGFYFVTVLTYPIPTHEEKSQVWHLNRSEYPIRICIKSVKICLK